MLKGFLSYAHEDASDLKTDLTRQFAEMDEDGIVRFWADPSLRAGDEWEKRLLKELNKADVFAVIVTPRALEKTSYVRNAELPMVAFNARRKNITVIPILAKKIHWEIGPLKSLQGCPSPPWISDPTSRAECNQWAHSVADDIRSTLLARHLFGDDKRLEAQGAQRLTLGYLEEFSESFSHVQPKLKLRTTLGVVRIIEGIRSCLRAPIVDLPEDAYVASQVAQRLSRAISDFPTLKLLADRLIESIAELIEIVHHLAPIQIYGSGEGETLTATWQSAAEQFAELESTMRALQDEAQYLRQHRRREKENSSANSIIQTMTGLATRKSGIIEGLLEEPTIDVKAIRDQTESLAFADAGFLSSLDIEVEEVSPALREASRKMSMATNDLKSAAERLEFKVRANAGLRKVRSEAANSEMVDLKRIRGIGVLIEKRLNAAGITSYDQIANWRADDVAYFSIMMDFKGRIERENWVEQARVLASGGFTEFSRRVDRGEV